MGDVISLTKLNRSQEFGDSSKFDLVFEDEKLLFDIGYENDKVVFFWYSEEDVNSEETVDTIYEKEVQLSILDKFLDKLLRRNSIETLKAKTFKQIDKSIKEFRKSVDLNKNMNGIITEISNAGKNNPSQVSNTN